MGGLEDTYRGPSLAEFEAIAEQMSRIVILLNEILIELRRLADGVERMGNGSPRPRPA
jgi:hypothetical protein